MKVAIRLFLSLAMAAMCAGALAKPPPSSPLDQTARVEGITDYERLTCLQSVMPADCKKDQYMGLEAGKSSFDLKHYSGFRFRIDVKGGGHKEAENPDFFLLNTDKLPNTKDPCEIGAYADAGFFAFAVHDIVNPDDGRASPHALIYIPFNAQSTGQPYLGTKFKLVVLNIENDSIKCDKYTSNWKKTQCLDLRMLAVLKLDQVPDYKFIGAVLDKIGEIVPPGKNCGLAESMPQDHPTMRFHNGVIHGTF
jgi:hypothetical protein